MVKKKIVYLTAAMGGGHNAAVQATMEAVEANYPGKFEHEIIDVMKLVGPNFEKIAGQLYEKSVNYAKFTFRAFFDITDKTDVLKYFDKTGYRTIKDNLMPILEARPSVIISCYPFLTYSVKRFLREYGADVPFITLITDTGEVHSAWINGETDYYFAPTEETAYFLRQRGVAPEKIELLGFPVKQLFYQNYNKRKIAKDLGLKPDNKVILYFTGAYGSGGLKEKLTVLDKGLENFTIIVVCGRNKTSYEWLKSQKFKNQVIPFGFVDNVAELMAIADLVITKAGGMSVMETVTSKKPVIVTEVYPGQEEPNAQFLETMGFGYIEKKPEGLLEKIRFIFESSEIERIKQNYRNYRLNDRADKKIARFIVDLTSRL